MSSLDTHCSQKPAGFNTFKPARIVRHRLTPILISLVFLATIGWAASNFTTYTGMTIFVIAAAVIGGYMAMIFETAGALIAGGDVVSTISKGIIDPALMPDSKTFILAMGSALLAAALWLNLATWVGAPVSTTHSIVGSVVGVGVVAAGFSAIN